MDGHVAWLCTDYGREGEEQVSCRNRCHGVEDCLRDGLLGVDRLLAGVRYDLVALEADVGEAHRHQDLVPAVGHEVAEVGELLGVDDDVVNREEPDEGERPHLTEGYEVLDVARLGDADVVYGDEDQCNGEREDLDGQPGVNSKAIEPVRPLEEEHRVGREGYGVETASDRQREPVHPARDEADEPLEGLVDVGVGTAGRWEGGGELSERHGREESDETVESEGDEYAAGTSEADGVSRRHEDAGPYHHPHSHHHQVNERETPGEFDGFTVLHFTASCASYPFEPQGRGLSSS